MNDAEEHRRKVRYFLTLSRQMGRPKDRAAMVEMAALWMKRAEQVEGDPSGDRATLLKRFHLAQFARREAIEYRNRVIEAIAQSRKLMAYADFVLTLPYVK
jgi:hypothetical protein